MTDDLLSRARALPRPATPGPWKIVFEDDSHFTLWGRIAGANGRVVVTTDPGAAPECQEAANVEDEEAIAALPEALALLDELIAEVERCHKALRYIAGYDVAGMLPHMRSEDVAQAALETDRE